ncbi:hypothetical protein [uncultured Tenacibaculum sp.]|uniref:hypothetical protein n=1 Tax=uncultured Tenacibaculum sp. TaxID=174713 RepID=UPI00262F4F68|nr:hypothetical protein [uncultured Tenacibaculum sp.]
MSKFKCKCRKIIRLNQIPNPNEWLIISDIDYDNYSGMIDSEKLYTKMESMFKCFNCGRLWVFWDGLDLEPTSYKIEKVDSLKEFGNGSN